MLNKAYPIILFLLAFVSLAIALPANITADSLASIDHIILFMQENRAFDHVSFLLNH